MARCSRLACCSLFLLAAAAPVAFAGTPYTYELVEPAGEFFQYVTLRLDALGRPHVAWSELTGTARLRYAFKDAGVWTVETAEGTDANHRYARLALDEDGNPAIVYGTLTSLRLARRSAGGVWSISTIDPNIGSTAYSGLEFDADGVAHVIYRKNIQWLRYANDAGGPWSFETVDSLQSPDAVRYASVALDPTGEPWVAYADYFNELLVAAHRQAGVWDRDTVDTEGVYGTSIAVDGLGPRIGYHSLGAPGLRLASNTGSGWQVEPIDPATPGPSPGCIECFPSTAIASDGTPYVTYQKLLDNDASGLMLAREIGSDWFADLVDAEGLGTGSYSSLVLDVTNTPHVAYTGSGVRAGIVYATPSGPTAVAVRSPAKVSMSCAPNPLRSGSALSARIELAEPDRAGFTLFDVHGRRVWASAPEWRPAGPQTLSLDFGPRPAGVYLLRLDAVSQGPLVRRIAIIE